MLFCPPIFDLQLYDAGLYPWVTIFPRYQVVNETVRGKWFWEVIVEMQEVD